MFSSWVQVFFLTNIREADFQNALLLSKETQKNKFLTKCSIMLLDITALCTKT